MQRLQELPSGCEFYFFSATVNPSGRHKPVPEALKTMCAKLRSCGRVAFHGTTNDTTMDAADRLMIQKAAELHVELPTSIAFLYVTNDRQLAQSLGSLLATRVTNDRLLAQSLGSLLARRDAVHWPHLHLQKNPKDTVIN